MSTEEQLAALRRQVRALMTVNLVALFVLAAFAAVFLLPGRPVRWQRAEAASAVQVESQEYRLLDPDGRLRGLWSCPPAGPALTLLDADGRVAVELRQGSIRLRDAEGRVIFEKP